MPEKFRARSASIDVGAAIVVGKGKLEGQEGVVVDKGKGWYKVRVPGVDSLTNLRGSDLSVVQPSPSPAAKKSPPLPCVGDSPAASPAAVAAARVVGSPARGVTNRVETSGRSTRLHPATTPTETMKGGPDPAVVEVVGRGRVEKHGAGKGTKSETDRKRVAEAADQEEITQEGGDVEEVNGEDAMDVEGQGEEDEEQEEEQDEEQDEVQDDEEEEVDLDAMIKLAAAAARRHTASAIAISSAEGSSSDKRPSGGRQGGGRKRRRGGGGPITALDSGLPSPKHVLGAEASKGATLSNSSSLETRDSKTAKLYAGSALYSGRDRAMLLERTKAPKDDTAGKGWFNMEQAEMTPELKRDLQVIRMRNYVDPKRFYKSSDKASKFMQIGTVKEGPAEYFSSRMTNKERKKTLVDELLVADDAFRAYSKNQYGSIQARKRAGGKAHYNELKRKRKGGLKWKP